MYLMRCRVCIVILVRVEAELGLFGIGVWEQSGKQ